MSAFMGVTARSGRAPTSVRLTLQQHGSAEDVRIHPKGIVPDGVADDGCFGTARSILFIIEVPSHDRTQTQNIEVMFRDARCLEILNMGSGLKIDPVDTQVR